VPFRQHWRSSAEPFPSAQYLHENGIVHRDIKPENILYMENSKDSTIKLADYGLSRCFEALDLNQGRVRMMSRCGSPNFVAPEVLDGSGYGKSCDIWSSGIILYILLCGFLPFDQAEVVGTNKEKVLTPAMSIVSLSSSFFFLSFFFLHCIEWINKGARSRPIDLWCGNS
jgi:serine/threonine protein kinase